MGTPNFQLRDEGFEMGRNDDLRSAAEHGLMQGFPPPPAIADRAEPGSAPEHHGRTGAGQCRRLGRYGQQTGRGIRIPEDSIAYRSGDIGIMLIYGIGFPAYRGGPMQYADEIDLDKVLAAEGRIFGSYRRSQPAKEKRRAQSR